jgi:hypothetical protein
MERFVRETGFVSCAKAAPAKARTAAIAHPRLNSILNPKQITEVSNYETVFAAVPTVKQNQPLSQPRRWKTAIYDSDQLISRQFSECAAPEQRRQKTHSESLREQAKRLLNERSAASRGGSSLGLKLFSPVSAQDFHLRL